MSKLQEEIKKEKRRETIKTLLIITVLVAIIAWVFSLRPWNSESSAWMFIGMMAIILFFAIVHLIRIRNSI